MTAELLQTILRPLIMDCPKTYSALTNLVETVNQGNRVTEIQAFDAYFETIQQKDPDYLHKVTKASEQLSSPTHRYELIVPAYREAENMDGFLTLIKSQFEQSNDNDWGITIVSDYTLSHKRKGEQQEHRAMQLKINHFLEENTQFDGRIQMVFYTKLQEMPAEVLGVGLARKFGEDITMLRRLNELKENQEKEFPPLYLGLMDMDTTNLTPMLLGNMIKSMPLSPDQSPNIIRVKGSYDKNDIKQNKFLHILQEIWEGSISEIGLNTKHNPFNIGRLSAIPARELALTGGGFAKKLNFTDEDIRHGIQIAWQLNNVKTVEINGQYSTSARRELQMLQGLLVLLEQNQGIFNVETLETAALIRMYGNWTTDAFRNHLGNIVAAKDFDQKHLPRLIEAITNAFYRFTLFGIFAVEELSQIESLPEAKQIKENFLTGKSPYFEVQIQTHELIQKLANTEPERFKKIEQVLRLVDHKARTTMANILNKNHIKFTYNSPDIPMLGFLEQGVEISRGTTADKIILEAPFKISPDQKEYIEKIKNDLEES